MTTVVEIETWFKDGVNRGAVRMLVVCDTFDHEDYPVYVGAADNFWSVMAQYDNKDMQRIVEVYDLKYDMREQLDADHVWRVAPWPKREETV